MEEFREIEDWKKCYGPRILKMVGRLLMDTSLAEDILQDTLIIAWNCRDQFEGRSSIATWIYRIALNRTLREKERIERGVQIAERLSRGGAGNVESLGIWQENGIGEPERELAEKEIANQIQDRCFWYYSFLLTGEQRSVFVLREALELDYAEISEVLGVSADVVRSRLSRARGRLRRHLAAKCSWVRPENSCHCEDRLPYVIAQFPEILDKYRRRLTTEDIQKRLESLDLSQKARLEKILRKSQGKSGKK